MQVGLFGGSFDPVHHGHLIVGRVAAETLGLESVRFVPAREQPFKRGQHGASPEQRAAMLELAVAGTPGFAVERAELERIGPSYTVDTLRALRAREPGLFQEKALARAAELDSILVQSQAEDFVVDNDRGRSITDVARAVLAGAGWLPDRS